MNALTKTNPMNPWRVFDALFDEPTFTPFAGRYPAVTVQTREKELVLEAEVPGVEPEKLDVAVDGQILTIKGERTRADGEAWTFERRFELPFAPDFDKMNAAVRNGILTLTIPKPTAPEARRLTIQAA